MAYQQLGQTLKAAGVKKFATRTALRAHLRQLIIDGLYRDYPYYEGPGTKDDDPGSLESAVDKCWEDAFREGFIYHDRPSGFMVVR